MPRASSQKFIARNRAPRVQIEYDVELYGAEKKIQLPFIMGVMANLSGNPTEPLPDVADRKFDCFGATGAAVLVSTLSTSVTCGPLCPGPTRTCRVSPDCTASMLL